MAIGSLDRAGRLRQLRDYAKVLVWSGYRRDDEVYADVLDAVLDECRSRGEAERLTSAYIDEARRTLAVTAATWPAATEYDALEAALAEVEDAGVVVLRACVDHWAATELLDRLRSAGSEPTGVAFFTEADVWHAIEHEMLEVNLWHGSGANVTPADALLHGVTEIFERHGLAAQFDEGRIEVRLSWQRRPSRPTV